MRPRCSLARINKPVVADFPAPGSANSMSCNGKKPALPRLLIEVKLLIGGALSTGLPGWAGVVVESAGWALRDCSDH